MVDVKPKKFRKKPIEVEAIQWDGWYETYCQIKQWAGDSFGNRRIEWLGEGRPLRIHTLEGVMEAQVGDWIIKGVKGEFYPCKPDIFEQTYEPDDIKECLCDY